MRLRRLWPLALAPSLFSQLASRSTVPASDPAALDSVVGQGGPPFLSATPPAAAFVAWSIGYVVVLGGLALRRFARRDL